MRIIICLLILLSINAYSIDWDKCRSSIRNNEMNVHWSYGATTHVYGTSQFSTSTGDCAMISQREHDQKVFLAHNYNQIQSDVSRGRGEYIEAYAYLSGCDKIALKRLPKVFKKNFTAIYGVDNSKGMKAIYEAMEAIIKSDPVLVIGCKAKS